MNALAGTRRLTRLAARRDLTTLSVWILGLTGFLAATTAMFVNSLVTAQDMAQEAALPTNNAGLRMLGLTSGPSVGGAVMVRDLVVLSVMAALMSVLAVVRHTRQAEELGRAEVVGSAVVGRYADLAAAVTLSLAANAVLAALLGLAMVVNGLPAGGAFTAGAAVAAVGAVFSGVAAVTVQLASTTRGAIGMSGAVLGVAFLLSGIGNMLGTPDTTALRVDSAWPAWLSPIGWAQQMRPFGGNHWWPLALFLLLLVLLLVTAVVLVGRRDVGAGVWPQRRGHAHASASLLSPAGLVLRLQRGALIGWTVGMVGFGLILGAMTEQIQDLEGRSREFYENFGGADRIVEAYLASMASMAAMVVAIYLVQIILRMRAEEAEGTLEPLLASGVTRSRWVAGYLVNALGGATLLMAAYAVSTGVGAGLVLGDTGVRVRQMVAAGLVQLPAVLLVGSIALVAVALVPRYAGSLAWAVVITSMALGPTFGPPLGLPAPILDLSPFTHVPTVPATDLTVAPLLVLAGICVTVGAVGATGLRRRNLALPA